MYLNGKTGKFLSRAIFGLAVFLLIMTFGVTKAQASVTTISGTLYEADRSTPYATPTTIKIAVATSSIATSTPATFSTTTVTTTGAFTFTIDAGDVATSTPLTVFVDGNAVLKAVTVTKTSGTSTITNLALYKDHVTIKNEGGSGTTTKASDLVRYDSTRDSDVQFTASSTLGRLTVASGQTLYVATGTTFQMDYPVVGHSFETATSATALASSTLALTGNFIQNGAFKTATSGEVAWTARTAAANNDWTSVTYGNGLFVAVSDRSAGTINNRVMTSSDGATWASSTAATDNSWLSVTYGLGSGTTTPLFVAVSGSSCSINNCVMTSPDGSNWTARTATAANNWTSITYGNGLFVAVANSGTISNRVMVSSDGTTWASSTAAANNNWTSVTYGNGLFVAVANSGTINNRVMTSSNGTTWASSTAAVDCDWSSVTYGNGLFVAVSLSRDGDNVDRVMTSPDGINWTARTSVDNTSNWPSVTYGNGLFVAVSDSNRGTINNRVMTSLDGVNWTARTAAANNNWQSITYGNGLFVALSDYFAGTVNNRVMTSAESMTLTLNGTTSQSLSGNLIGTNSLPSIFATSTGAKTFLNNASTSVFFTIATSSGVVTAPSALTVDGNLVNRSNYTAGTNTYLTGNYTNTGTFTHNNGTVFITGEAVNKQTLSGTLTGASAFKTLRFTKPTTSTAGLLQTPTQSSRFRATSRPILVKPPLL